MSVRELQEQEMLLVNGGSLTSAVINAITNVINTIYQLGEATGSALRRLINEQYCPLK